MPRLAGLKERVGGWFRSADIEPRHATRFVLSGSPLADSLAAVAENRLARVLRDGVDLPPPGIQIAFAHRGNLLMAISHGVRSPGQPMTSDSIFKVASQSKIACALTALRLVEAGELDLDEPIWKRLTSWRMPAGVRNGVPVDGMTLRHLLSHRSGLMLKGFPQWPATDGPGAPGVRELLNGCAGPDFTAQMVHTPGEALKYSGAAYALVQILLEDASGMSYSELVQKEVLDPLGLRDTWTGLRPNERGRIVAGHLPDGTPVSEQYYPALGPSGMFSTASDLARLFSAITACVHDQADFRALGSKHAADMLRPQSPPDDKGHSFGLGPVIVPWDNCRVMKHAGWCDGFWGTSEGIVELECTASVLCSMSYPAGQIVATRLATTLLREARTHAQMLRS